MSGLTPCKVDCRISYGGVMIVLLQAPGVQKTLSQYLVVEKKKYFSWLCDLFF